jgi:uncharacterized membrane protein (UPF0127 family)
MTPAPRVTVRLQGSGALIARAAVADTALRRMRGLLGRDGLADGEGLMIDPCSSIHTCFMRFPIDVLFLDRQGRILRAIERLTPFRFVSGGRGTRRTLELSAGTICRQRLDPGAILAVEPM